MASLQIAVALLSRDAYVRRLMLAKCNLPFRGSSKELSTNNKDNFLSIIQFLAKYDTVLDKLLQLPKGSPKYLSPLLQNDLISVLVEEVFRDIKSELHALLFLPLLSIPLKMSAKKLSKIFRFVKIDYHDDGTPSELKVV